MTLKSEAEIARMRAAGRVVAAALQRVADAARPGVRLRDLDEIGGETIREAGAKSSFIGYHPGWAPTPYPAQLCFSVNDAVVHGIPTDYVLRDGDILSVDCGAVLHGFHGDAAVTVPIGQIDDADRRLIAATREALDAGIAAAVAGNRLGDISHAIETVGRRDGYGLLEWHGGHGIGTSMHEDPHVPNSGRPGRGMRLREGLVLALEPMLLRGGRDTYRTLPDGWTLATDDGSRAAHVEHTVAITAAGPEVLTVI